MAHRDLAGWQDLRETIQEIHADKRRAREWEDYDRLEREYWVSVDQA
jgi:hypothetical protein